jgi:hypothetical protein
MTLTTPTMDSASLYAGIISKTFIGVYILSAARVMPPASLYAGIISKTFMGAGIPFLIKYKRQIT